MELLLCLGDLFWSEHAVVSTEERYNARAGLQLLCGHTDAMWDLQYTNFCGGCTAESILSVPVYQSLGPTVLAWKMVPLGFHMGILALGAWVCHRMIGLSGAVGWMALMMAAPPVYRSLALTGFGNHAEVGLFPLLSFVLVMAATRISISNVASRCGLSLIAGAVSGLGLWFSYTSAYAIPALLLVGFWGLRSHFLPVLLGLPIGFLPWWRYQTRTEEGVSAAWDRWVTIDFAPLGALKRWIWTDPVSSLWPAAEPGVDQSFWWFCLLVVAAVGMRALIRDQEQGPGRWWVPLATLGLWGAWWVRHDLWSDNPPVLSYDPFNLRYRIPWFPLLFLSAASALRGPYKERKKVTLIVAVLVAMGLGQRLNGWEMGSQQVLAGVYEVSGEPDRTVPSGLPIQRNVHSMGRSQDVEAAVQFLDSHADPFPECRNDHMSELGRRVGLSLRQNKDASLTQMLGDRWHELTVEERRALAQGIQRGLDTGSGGISKKAACRRLRLAVRDIDLGC